MLAPSAETRVPCTKSKRRSRGSYTEVLVPTRIAVADTEVLIPNIERAVACPSSKRESSGFIAPAIVLIAGVGIAVATVPGAPRATRGRVRLAPYERRPEN